MKGNKIPRTRVVEKVIVILLAFVSIALGMTGQAAAANSNRVTPGKRVASAMSATAISVASPFTGDANQNSYTVYEYSTSETGLWTQACVNGIPGESAWRRCLISGLSPATKYFVRVTFYDPDGVNGTNPRIIGPIKTPAKVVNASSFKSAKARVSDTHILVKANVLGDANLDSTLTLDVATSASGPWTQKCGPQTVHRGLCRIHGLVRGTNYYVRVTVGDPDGVTGTNPRILGPIQYTGRTNLALNKPIAADPGWGCCWDPTQLVDGVIQYPAWDYGHAWTGGNSGWGGGQPGPKQATIDLGSAQLINRLDFFTHDPGNVPLDWEVQVSDDGVNFTQVFHDTSPHCRAATIELETAWYSPACAQRAVFKPVSARYVKYVFDDRTLFNGIHGWAVELEVFGPEARNAGAALQ